MKTKQEFLVWNVIPPSADRELAMFISPIISLVLFSGRESHILRLSQNFMLAKGHFLVRRKRSRSGAAVGTQGNCPLVLTFARD